jgi:hypothetical protein
MSREEKMRGIEGYILGAVLFAEFGVLDVWMVKLEERGI